MRVAGRVPRHPSRRIGDGRTSPGLRLLPCAGVVLVLLLGGIPGALALGRGTAGPESSDGPRSRTEIVVVDEPDPVPALLAGLTVPCLVAVWLVLAHRARQHRSSPALAPIRRLVDTAFEGLLIHDGTRIVEVNAVFARLIGVPAAGLIGRGIYALISDEGRELARSHVRRRSDAPYEIDFVRGDGTRFPALVRGRSVTDAGGRSLRVVAVRDLTEQRRNEARLRELAFRDPLTGLANRDYFHLQLAQALASAERNGSAVALLCIDIDRFKELNEVAGARAADRALCDLAALLTENIREGDTVARLSADQFAIVLPGVERPDDAAGLAQQLIEVLRARSGSGTVPPVQISVGVTLAPQDGTDTELLLRRAEVACRRAKDAGGAAVRSFAPGMDAQLRERRELELKLRAALAAERLEVHFQPLSLAASREVRGFEALLRWTDPELGPIPPDRFIPLAEERGLVGALGRFVLDRACRTAATWPAPCFVAINLSPLQFLEGDLVGDVERALASAGLPPARLELEITEGLLLRREERVVRQLQALKARGVRIVLDDFGTGYASLSYLQSFPFDKLKIDRSFIASTLDDPGARAIVDSVVGLGRRLSMTVVAEGVETEAQRRFLTGIGCDMLQGYLLGRAVPPEETARLVRAHDGRSVPAGTRTSPDGSITQGLVAAARPG